MFRFLHRVDPVLLTLVVVALALVVMMCRTRERYLNRDGDVITGKAGYNACKADCKERCGSDEWKACAKYNCSQDNLSHNTHSYFTLMCGAGGEGGCKWGPCPNKSLKRRYPCKGQRERMCCRGSDCVDIPEDDDGGDDGNDE